MILDELIKLEKDEFSFNKKKFNLDLFNTDPIQRIDNEDFIRTYRTINNDIYASVTSMLSLTGNNDFLDYWKQKLARNQQWTNTNIYGKDKLSKEELTELGERLGSQIAKSSAESGNYMHDTLEQYVLGNELSYNGDKGFLVENIVPALNEHLGKVHLVEGQLWSDRLEVAGTLDLLGYWKGKLSIIDYKNSLKPRREKYNIRYYIQSCIYAIMVKERYGIWPDYIVILVSINDKFSNIKFQEFRVPVAKYISKVVERIKLYREHEIYFQLKDMK
jgi:genome maintenance exonuclease 1